MELHHGQDDSVIQRENRILSAVAYVANILLKSANWKDALDPALEQLGKAAAVNRCYYFENSVREDGEILTSVVAEWATPGVESQVHNPEMQNFGYVENGMGRWLELMQQRKPVYGLTSSLPDPERIVFEAQDILSLVVTPVFYGDQLNGFLGFDDCETLRQWSTAELDALSAAASAIGAAIERHHLENQLRFAQKMEAIGSLASGVAHDFNNVLQAIVSFTNVARLKIDSQHPAQGELSDVLEASNRAHSLTQQLLSFSRRRETVTEHVNICEVSESAIKMVRATMQPGIEIVTEYREPDAGVEADAGLMTQVMLNLALNACDAMPDGGTLKIAVDSRDESAIPAAQPNDGECDRFVCISVSDTGVGMTEDVQERIFEPFFTTRKDGGTGLGLSVVYSTVKQFGGWIDVRSDPHSGAQFDVFLPAIQDSAEKTSSPQEGKIQTGTETILLVDDEAMVLQPTQTLLEVAGYRVLAARSGPDGLELFRQHQHDIDVVVSDSVMPGMTGSEMLGEIFAIRANVPAILVSGNPDSIQRPEGTGHRIVVINKPYSNQSLHAALRRLLD